jgi:hypothetical protein
MRSHRIVVFALTLLLLVWPGTGLRGQTEASGTWELTLPPPPPDGGRMDREARPGRGERRRGPPPLTLVLEQDGESLTGTVNGPERQVGTASGSVQGDEVTLRLILLDPEGGEHQLQLEGVLEGEDMAGTLMGRPDGLPRSDRPGAPEGRGPDPEWKAQRLKG